MQKQTRRLWGQEFNIVAGGLDEKQVVEFGNELMKKYRVLVERQEHFLSLGTLSERASIEANKVSTEIRTRAKKEAEEEAAITVARARERAKDILATARSTVQDVSRRETDSILNAARRKALTIESEANQKSQLFLIRAREIIESDLKGQFREVYDQLLSSLRDLIGEGHDIESSWKGKIVELWKKEPLPLESPETLSSALVSEIAKTSSIAGASTEIPQTELDARAEEVFFEASSKVTEEAYPVQAAADEGFIASPVETLLEEPVTTVEETVFEEPVVATMEAPLPEEEDWGTVAEDISYQKAEPSFESPEVAVGTVYEDEVEMTLLPPIELATMSRIYDQLQLIPELKILRTVGTWDKGTTITAFLEKPVQLLEILSKIPGVAVTSEQSITPREREMLKAMGKEKGKSKISLKTQP